MSSRRMALGSLLLCLLSPAGCDRTAPPSVAELKRLVSEASSVPARWYSVGERGVVSNFPGDAVGGPAEPPGAPLFVAAAFASAEGDAPAQLPGAALLAEEEQKRDEAAERAEFEMLMPPHRVFVGPAIMSREWFDIICPPRPDGPGGRSPYVSLIHPEYITGLTRQVHGDTITGTVAFEARDAYRGKVNFIARRGPGGWRVVEFRLPLLGGGSRLQAGGMWAPIQRDDETGEWVVLRQPQ